MFGCIIRSYRCEYLFSNYTTIIQDRFHLQENPNRRNLQRVEQAHIDTAYEHKYGPFRKYHMTVLSSSVFTNAMHTVRYDFINEVFAQQLEQRRSLAISEKKQEVYHDKSPNELKKSSKSRSRVSEPY